MPPRQRPQGPTLDEIRLWPAMVSVEDAAWALRVSRAYAYRLLQHGQLPVRTKLVGSRRVVVTSSLISYIADKSEDDPGPGYDQDVAHRHSPGRTPGAGEAPQRTGRPAGPGYDPRAATRVR
ncbi:helix-turn-helix domain-containing protein [Actinosynnema sp. NPDC023587]|uniref:helix-turn-helix domain-containing protein n=1 Tax=Actinosynnema sp. NPDC023587 TaxID=3154695 RepID=UPI0033CDFD9C